MSAEKNDGSDGACDRSAPASRARPARPTDGGREQGFALLIVLWTLVLTTLVVTSLIAAARQELHLQENLRSAAVAEAAADGAVQEAVFRLTAGEWSADPSLHRLRIGEAAVAVAIENVAGKVNPNSVPVPLLSALLEELGLDSGNAAQMANAIVDFVDRESNSPGSAVFAQYAAAGLPYGPLGVPYSDIGQLRMVIGMTPQILARLRPELSVWSGDALDPTAADPIVARAYRDAQATAGIDNSADRRPDMYPYDIIATAVTPDGARFTRLATVRINGSGRAATRRPAFQILSWGRPEP